MTSRLPRSRENKTASNVLLQKNTTLQTPGAPGEFQSHAGGPLVAAFLCLPFRRSFCFRAPRVTGSPASPPPPPLPPAADGVESSASTGVAMAPSLPSLVLIRSPPDRAPPCLLLLLLLTGSADVALLRRLRRACWAADAVAVVVRGVVTVPDAATTPGPWRNEARQLLLRDIAAGITNAGLGFTKRKRGGG